MSELTAAAARELAAEKSGVERFVANALARIREAAINGHLHVDHPFWGSDPYPTPTQEAAATQALRDLGYSVTHHKAPESNDPRETDWIEVAW